MASFIRGCTFLNVELRFFYKYSVDVVKKKKKKKVNGEKREIK